MLIVGYGVNEPPPPNQHQRVLDGLLMIAETFELPLSLLAGDDRVLQLVAAADAEWLDSLR